MTSLYTRARGGYIALTATIIISLVLLAMIGEESFSGFFLRSSVLSTEHKAQSASLASGCAATAVAALAADPTYSGGEEVSFTAGDGAQQKCSVALVEFDTPAPGQARMSTQAQVGGAYTTLSTVVEMGAVGEALQQQEILGL